MILADPATFTREHYEAQRGLAPAHLCELVVHCLELVAQLAARGVPFRFKGGNSQLVLLAEPRRFSIDVDIVTTISKEELTAHVEEIAHSCELFTRCEVRPHQTKPWLPMISYRVFFPSIHQPPAEAFVMLDAVLEPAPYPGVRQSIACAGLYAAPQEVELPSISGLLADKLLCIGPSTLGIPLGKGKEAQRLKHVFDVANLSRHPHTIEHVEAALASCMAQELEIQKRECSRADVLADTRRFLDEALSVATPPDPARLPARTYLTEIVVGFSGLQGFLFREDYPWEAFQADCRRVTELVERLPG
jgi:hypothetical protein